MSFLCFACGFLHAAPLRLLAIGDSLTTKYEIELTFSAPDSDIDNANTRNWVEILGNQRSSLVSLTSGNFAIPGSTADYWDDVLTDTSFNPLTLALQFAIIQELGQSDAAIIFLGGNDLKSNYTGIYADAAPPAFLAAIPGHIAAVHQFIRSKARANFPIIIATLPDISATPDIALNPGYSDPILAARSRQRIAAVNAQVIALAISRPNTYIARIDNLTDRILDQVPFHINGTEFTYFDAVTGRENPPLHLFCKDGFHPSTVSQALIANEILKAINSIAPASTRIPLFANRDILAIIGQNPDQPYLDWAGSAGGMLENPDGDALPNLLEYLLGTSATSPDAAFEFLPGGDATFTPSANAQRFADLSILQSETLADDWIAVPAGNILTMPDSSRKIIPTATKLFYKFQATPKP